MQRRGTVLTVVEIYYSQRKAILPKVRTLEEAQKKNSRFPR